MAFFNGLVLILVFRLKRLDGETRLLSRLSFILCGKHIALLVDAGQIPDDQVSTVQKNKYRQIIGLKRVYILAIFALIYIGIEATIGGMFSFHFLAPRGTDLSTICIGWIVTYVIHQRGGGHNAGYVASGFWAGMSPFKACRCGLDAE